MPKTTRTFIGLPIPEPNGRKLIHLQERLARQVPGVRWVESTGFHVTLNFLGEVIDTDLHLVCRSVVEVVKNVEVFEASLEGLGAFPDPTKPRVIWAGLKEDGNPLVELHHELAKALVVLGYRSDELRFHPHVTIGRVKNDGSTIVDLTPLITSNRVWSGGSFKARELIIYASNFGPNGPVYSTLGRAQLRSIKRGSKA